jgi:predicted ribosomally synthesized peptide with SipW-like signal peptide
MKRIVLSLFTIAAVAVMATGATSAYLSDTETSIGNTFSAGTLDLNLDGDNINVVKFNVSNMVPGNQPTRSWVLKNVGTVNGYLDIENVVISGYENDCTEPEVEAGDVTCGINEGELQNLLGVYLFVDYGNDGWFSVGDKVIYNGLAKNMPTHFELNEMLAANASTSVRGIINWWSTPNDNLAQTDSMTLDLTFELSQTTGQ